MSARNATANNSRSPHELGGGNIYARIGSVEKWLDDMDETLYDEGEDDDESD